MGKIIRVNDTKAYRVEAINIKGTDLISVRQLYATRNDPTLKPSKAGITLAPEEALRIAKALQGIVNDPKTKFKAIELQPRGKGKGD